MQINNLDVSRTHREASVNLHDFPVIYAKARTFLILPLDALFIFANFLLFSQDASKSEVDESAHESRDAIARACAF